MWTISLEIIIFLNDFSRFSESSLLAGVCENFKAHNWIITFSRVRTFHFNLIFTYPYLKSVRFFRYKLKKPSQNQQCHAKKNLLFQTWNRFSNENKNILICRHGRATAFISTQYLNHEPNERPIPPISKSLRLKCSLKISQFAFEKKKTILLFSNSNL